MAETAREIRALMQARNRLPRLNEKGVQGLPLCPLKADAVDRYAEIRAHLDSLGTPIGANDYWIAAQALAVDAILVTDNEHEFQRIPRLRIENWLRGSAPQRHQSFKT